MGRGPRANQPRRIRPRPPSEVLCGSTMVHSSAVIGHRIDERSAPVFAQSLPAELTHGTYSLSASELAPSNALRIALTNTIGTWREQVRDCIPRLDQDGYDRWIEQAFPVHVLLNREGTVVHVAVPRASSFMTCVRSRLMNRKTEPVDLCDNTWIQFPPFNHSWVQTSRAEQWPVTSPTGQRIGVLPAPSCLFSLSAQGALDLCPNNYWFAEGVLSRMIHDASSSMRDGGRD